MLHGHKREAFHLFHEGRNVEELVGDVWDGVRAGVRDVVMH